MRGAYIYDERDNQGPWVPLCEDCIRADRADVTSWDATIGSCACCQETLDDRPARSPIRQIDGRPVYRLTSAECDDLHPLGYIDFLREPFEVVADQGVDAWDPEDIRAACLAT